MTQYERRQQRDEKLDTPGVTAFTVYLSFEDRETLRTLRKRLRANSFGDTIAKLIRIAPYLAVPAVLSPKYRK